jgi:hypothetical protein
MTMTTSQPPGSKERTSNKHRDKVGNVRESSTKLTHQRHDLKTGLGI